MKPHACIHGIALALIAVACAVSAAPTTPPAAPAGKLVRPELPKSVFVLPASPQEGRDPFFPYSVRVYTENPKNIKPAPQDRAPSMADLVVKGIYTAEDGHVIALINNHPVGVGEDATITTKGNQRVNIHCRAINQAMGTVTVDSNGATVVLTVTRDQ